MITQQLLSQAKTLTTFMKDGGFSIYITEAVVCWSQRCVNANWRDADGNMARWEYGEMGSAADGRTAPYLSEGKQKVVVFFTDCLI